MFPDAFFWDLMAGVTVVFGIGFLIGFEAGWHKRDLEGKQNG